jgi:hypothetical protein
LLAARPCWRCAHDLASPAPGAEERSGKKGKKTDKKKRAGGVIAPVFGYKFKVGGRARSKAEGASWNGPGYEASSQLRASAGSTVATVCCYRQAVTVRASSNRQPALWLERMAAGTGWHMCMHLLF